MDYGQLQYSRQPASAAYNNSSRNQQQQQQMNHNTGYQYGQPAYNTNYVEDKPRNNLNNFPSGSGGPRGQRKKSYQLAAEQLAAGAHEDRRPSTRLLREREQMQKRQQQQINWGRSVTTESGRRTSGQPTKNRSQGARATQQQYNTTYRYNNASPPQKTRYSAKQVWKVRSCSAALTVIVIFLGTIFVTLALALHIADVVDAEGGATSISLWRVCVTAGRGGSLCDRQNKNLIYGSMCTTPFLHLVNGNTSAVVDRRKTTRSNRMEDEGNSSGAQLDEREGENGSSVEAPIAEENKIDNTSRDDDDDESTTTETEEPQTSTPTAYTTLQPTEQTQKTPEPIVELEKDSSNKVYVTDYSYARYYSYRDRAVRVPTGEQQCYSVDHWLNAVVPPECNIKELIISARALSITVLVLFVIAGALMVGVYFCDCGTSDNTADRTRQLMGMISCLLVVLTSAMFAVFIGVYRNPRKFTCGVRMIKPGTHQDLLQSAGGVDRLVPEEHTEYHSRSMYSEGWAVGVGPVCSGLCIAAALCMAIGSYRLKSSAQSWSQYNFDYFDEPDRQKSPQRATGAAKRHNRVNGRGSPTGRRPGRRVRVTDDTDGISSPREPPIGKRETPSFPAHLRSDSLRRKGSAAQREEGNRRQYYHDTRDRQAIETLNDESSDESSDRRFSTRTQRKNKNTTVFHSDSETTSSESLEEYSSEDATNDQRITRYSPQENTYRNNYDDNVATTVQPELSSPHVVMAGSRPFVSLSSQYRI